MKICLLITTIFALVLCGCHKKYTETLRSNTSNPSEDKLELPDEFGGDIDSHAILSVWYVHQYRAVDLLNRIEGVQLETGSKINESPASMLNKQHECITNLKTAQLDSPKFKMWIELQERVAIELYSKLGMKIVMSSEDATSAEKAKMLFELQMTALQKLE